CSKFGHLGNSPGIVRNGPVGVNGQLYAQIGQHAHGSDRYSVESGKVMGDQNGRCDQQDRNGRGHHAHTQARYDIGGRTRFGLAHNGKNGFFSGSGIIFCDLAHQEAGNKTGNGGPEDPHGGILPSGHAPGFGQHGGNYEIGSHQHQDGGDQFPEIQGILWIAPVLDLDKESAHNGHHNSHSGQYHGQINGSKAVKRPLKFRKGDKESPQYHGTDDRSHIGFKKVGTHSGHIPDIVPHIVRNGGGVQGVILRNTCFHLAHQVRSNVGGLGVDSPAHTGEKSYGGCPQGKARKYVQNFGQGPALSAVDHKKYAQSQYPETHDPKAHYGSTGKGHFQCLAQGSPGRLGGPYVGLGGHPHPDKASQGGTDGTDNKGYGHHSIGSGFTAAVDIQ